MNFPALGALRARIIIEREDPTGNDGGSYAPNWTQVANLWAQIEPVTGRVVRQGERLESHITHRVTLRYRTDITAGMRIVCGAQLLTIQAVLDLGARHRFLQLLAQEGGGT